MLKLFRKKTATPFIKTLMLLLILTFALWGIGDFINQQNRIVALKVGDKEIYYEDWNDFLFQRVREIEAEIGKKLTPEDIAVLGIKKMALNEFINRLLLENEAKEMGILVSDDMAKFEISSMPMLIKNGKFDNDALQNFLSATNMTEERFVEMIKEDIAVSNLNLALSLNKEFPNFYTETLDKARNTERKFDLYSIDRKNVVVEDKMSEIEEKVIYEANKEKFALPEMRNVSYIPISLDLVRDEAKITDVELKDAYNLRKEIFSSPERRHVLQMLFKDNEKASEAQQKLEQSGDFLAVAKEFFSNQNTFSLGENITEKSFDDDISEVVFSTAEKSYTEVIKSPIGSHIFYIEKVKPAEQKSFEEVKDELQKQLKIERRYELFNNIVQEIEQDALNAEDLNEIADKYSIKIKRVDSLTAADAIDASDMLKARLADIAFSMQSGEISNAYPLDEKGNYFIMQLRSVKPKNYRGIGVVKQEIAKIWQEEKVNERFAKLAKSMHAEVLSGNNNFKTLKANREKGLTLSWYKAKTSGLPVQLKEEILKAPIGAITTPITSKDGKKFYVAKIVDINKNIPAKSADEKGMNLELAVGAMEVYKAQYLNYLRNKYEVKVLNF